MHIVLSNERLDNRKIIEIEVKCENNQLKITKIILNIMPAAVPNPSWACSLEIRLG